MGDSVEINPSSPANEDHIELQREITNAEYTISLLKTTLVRIMKRLTSLDGIQYGDHKTSDSYRVTKQALGFCVRHFPTELHNNEVEHLHWILDELEHIHDRAVVVNRLIPAPDSELHAIFGPNSRTNITAEEWSYHNLVQRRNQQIAEYNFQYTNNYGRFVVSVPSAFRCPQCLSNDHVLAQCHSKRPVCLKCKVRGHIAAYCKWQLCAFCKRFGHGRQRCSSDLPGPACLKCGYTGHDPERCPNPNHKNK
jgi:hypothetical protein